jgi:hypothetical protein
VDRLAIYDDRILILLLVVSLLSGLLAFGLACKRRAEGHQDHYSAAGLVMGIIGSVWAAMLAARMI